MFEYMKLEIRRVLRDLLGHSLSLIALKSELAGRLIEVSPERVQAEIRDIEQVTREALREAVNGYRQPDHNAELYGARAALEAAGIECRIENRIGKLTPTAEAALGWAVREGVTNVIRHSAAANCHIELSESPEAVQLTLVDDGTGPDQAMARQGDRSGTGIAGLHERFAALGGQVETSKHPEGGFRLSVQIPLSEPPSDVAVPTHRHPTSGRLILREQP